MIYITLLISPALFRDQKNIQIFLNYGFYFYRVFVIKYSMKKITILLIISAAMGQYDYSLEDLNPSSEYYGNNVGATFFGGKITMHYFGHFT